MVMRTLWQWMQKRIPFWAVIGLVSAVIATFPYWLNLDFVEASLYDLRMARAFPNFLQHAPSQEMILVAVDDHSAKALDEVLPLSMESHARFMEEMAATYHPKGVGYVMDLNEVSNLRDTDKSRFVEAARKLESEARPILLGTPYEVTGEREPPFPLSQLPHAIALIHKDTNVFSEDRVTRRAFSHLSGRPAFHLDLAQRLGWAQADLVPKGAFTLSELDATLFFFRYHRNPTLDPSNRDFHQPRGPYRIIPFVDVLRHEIPTEMLKDKLVLVGKINYDDPSDFATTPFSRAIFATPKLSVHANILDTVAHNDSILRVGRSVQWMLTFALTFAALFWVFVSAPIQGVLGMLALSLLTLVGATLLFQLGGMWIRLAEPLFGIVLGYYLGIPYRLLSEYQTRWDYQRKTELLTQVEELKTNFLSLVTHDLKTPVARIQGLSEQLLRAKAGLAEADAKATAGQILKSTDELNHFISSILELNRIESNRVNLNLASRDVNQILERAVETFREPARLKGIRIQLETEPLFPSRVDGELLHKVFRNLIDNAIKYSPEGGTVTVRSFERTDQNGDEIGVSITDQGIGLSEDERKYLFTRFFRAKNDTTTRVPGTGLGLYLSKYFIEAHGGRIAVESAPAQGSTFQVFLPLEGASVPARGLKTESPSEMNRSQSHA